ncbi:MAG: CNNM domain-containing protein [Candidatus Poseidoniaceae archaeon]
MSIEPVQETSQTGALHIMVLEALAAAGPAIDPTGTGDVRLLTFYIVLALGISFLCSILEAVVLSVTQTWVAVQKNNGTKAGELWSALKEDDAVGPLTAILTLNTISHTMGAAGVGSQVQLIYGDGALTLASILLTLAMLLLSEIVPKTIGAAYWKQLARPCGSLLRIVVWSMTILIVPIQILKRVLPKGELNLVSRDDVAALADLGEERGVLNEDEEAIIHNLLRLRDIQVQDVMTPRTVMQTVHAESTVLEVTEAMPVLRFSRMPVLGEGTDDVLGLVLRSRILRASSNDEHGETMTDLMQPITRIRMEQSVEEALDLFLETKQHFALVTNEFGGTEGAVTLEDVFETLIGEEIVDELDEVEDMREYAREQAALSSEE